MGCCFSAPNPAGHENGHAEPQGYPLNSNGGQPELLRNASAMDPEQLAYSSPKFMRGSVKAVYKFNGVIAEGGFAQVIEVVRKGTQETFACKVMTFPSTSHPNPDAMSREDIFREISISAGLDHKNIVPLIEFYVDKKKIYMIFELMSGGRLLEVVLQRPPEASTRKIFRQLIEGIGYLHSKNVTHRDLKLENILLERKDDLESIKIADFGLAKQTARPLQTMCGTLYYVAPEVIAEDRNKTYGKAVDMWSAGVLLYVLLSGLQPFAGKSDSQIFDKILGADYGFDKPQWRDTSDLAKDLVGSLLEISSTKRLTAAQVLEHPWMKQG
ncbi:hypothetical protein BSKO_12965 [Bryopsis sp. KO-2023]|nr:hypothetical protein BSKO_12965 [Bryopsis sp. KO-2023]